MVIATLMMMVTVETITDDDGCGFIKAIISNNFTQICWVATPPTDIQRLLKYFSCSYKVCWQVIPPIHCLFKQIHSIFGQKLVKVTPKEANHHHGHEIKKRHIKIRKGPNLQQKRVLWKRLKETERVSIESGKSPRERFRQCLFSYFRSGAQQKKYFLPSLLLIIAGSGFKLMQCQLASF